MQAARFMTYCFVYIGLVIMAQYALFYGISLELNAIVQFAGGLAILSIGGVRLWKPEEEQYPEEYGLLTYGMAAVSVFVTVTLLASVLIL